METGRDLQGPMVDGCVTPHLAQAPAYPVTLRQLLPGKWPLFAKVAGRNGQVVDIHLAIAVDVNC